MTDADATMRDVFAAAAPTDREIEIVLEMDPVDVVRLAGIARQLAAQSVTAASRDFALGAVVAALDMLMLYIEHHGIGDNPQPEDETS